MPKASYYVVALCLVLLAACTKLEETRPGESGEIKEQEGWNSEIITSKDGNKSAVIRYGHMFQLAKKKIIHFNDGIEIDVYDEGGEHLSNARADSGVLRENTEDIEAHGHVVLVSDSGQVLQTERIFWDNKNQKWYSDAPTVFVQTEGDTVYSIGFESDKNFENYQAYQLRGVSDRQIDLDLDKRFKPRTVADDSGRVTASDSLAKTGQ